MKVYVDKNSNVEVNKTEIFDQCLCVKCKIEIKQSVIVNIIHSEDYGEFQLYKNNKILKCINCDSITYKNEVVNSEEVYQIGEEYDGTPIYEDNAQIQLYPIRDEETAFSKEFEKILPTEIYSTYEEVIIALNNKMPLLTALGLRTLLEQIIKYFGHSEDLGEILNQFEKDGFISTKQRELLDKIRYLGNDAAHRADTKSRKDLILNLKVLENLIQQLFVYYKIDEAKKIKK